MRTSTFRTICSASLVIVASVTMSADPKPAAPPAKRDELITRTYRVSPYSFEGFVVACHISPPPPTKLDRVRAEVYKATNEDIKTFFVDAGIPFPPGSSVAYSRPSATLQVTNTIVNLDNIEKILAEIHDGPPHVSLEVQLVRLARKTVNEILKLENQIEKKPFAGLSSILLKQIEDLQRRKKATIIAQPRLLTRSGRQAEMKSVVEVEYPVELIPSDTVPIPTTFAKREVGTILDVSSQVERDDWTIQITIAFERCLADKKGHKIQFVSSPNSKSVKLEYPQFSTQKIATEIQMWTGSTHLLAVWEELPSEKRAGEDNVILVLLSASLLSNTAK